MKYRRPNLMNRKNYLSYRARLILHFKRTVCVNSSNPPCKDGNARFTTVPLKLYSDYRCGRYSRFLTRVESV